MQGQMPVGQPMLHSPVMVYNPVSPLSVQAVHVSCQVVKVPLAPVQMEPSPTTGMPYPPPAYQPAKPSEQEARPWAASRPTPGPSGRREVWHLLDSIAGSCPHPDADQTSSACPPHGPLLGLQERSARRDSNANDDGYHWRK